MQPEKICDWLHTYRGFTWFKPQKIFAANLRGPLGPTLHRPKIRRSATGSVRHRYCIEYTTCAFSSALAHILAQNLESGFILNLKWGTLCLTPDNANAIHGTLNPGHIIWHTQQHDGCEHRRRRNFLVTAATLHGGLQRAALDWLLVAAESDKSVLANAIWELTRNYFVSTQIAPPKSWSQLVIIWIILWYYSLFDAIIYTAVIWL
jgi:hypothetical protein